jgi:hypothetical protein
MSSAPFAMPPRTRGRPKVFAPQQIHVSLLDQDLRWVVAEADSRGIPLAQVVRECVELARPKGRKAGARR